MKMDNFEKTTTLIVLVGIAFGLLLMRWLFNNTVSAIGFFTLYAANVLMVILLCRVVYAMRYKHEVRQGLRFTNGWCITSFGQVPYYGERSNDGKYFRWVELTEEKRREFIGIGLLLVPGQRHSIFSMAFTGG